MAYQNGSLRKMKRKKEDVWYFRYREGGKEVAVKIGAFPTKTAARKEVDRLGLREKANTPIKNNESVPVMFSRVVGLWLKKELSTQAATSQNGIRSYLRCHILPKWSKILVNKIKPKDMRDWLYSLHDDEELSGETVKKIKNTMGAIFAFGMFEELLPSNPAQGWRLKGMKSDYEPVIVQPSDTMRIIDALENPLHKVLMLLVACTGLRASEAVGLRWGDKKDGLIQVRRRWSAATLDVPKTERSKAPVACHPTLLHFLSEWRKMSAYASDSDWIFPSLKMRGRIPMSAGIFVTDYLRPAALKVGVVIPDGQRFGLHSFRSSLATWMISIAKTDMKTAQGSLRWKNPQIMLDKYARSVTDEMVAAQGRFLEACGMAVERKILPQSATDRIQRVGA
jgi:integrase